MQQILDTKLSVHLIYYRITARKNVHSNFVKAFSSSSTVEFLWCLNFSTKSSWDLVTKCILTHHVVVVLLAIVPMVLAPMPSSDLKHYYIIVNFSVQYLGISD